MALKLKNMPGCNCCDETCTIETNDFTTSKPHPWTLLERGGYSVTGGVLKSGGVSYTGELFNLGNFPATPAYGELSGRRIEFTYDADPGSFGGFWTTHGFGGRQHFGFDKTGGTCRPVIGKPNNNQSPISTFADTSDFRAAESVTFPATVGINHAPHPAMPSRRVLSVDIDGTEIWRSRATSGNNPILFGLFNGQPSEDVAAPVGDSWIDDFAFKVINTTDCPSYSDAYIDYDFSGQIESLTVTIAGSNDSQLNVAWNPFYNENNPAQPYFWKWDEGTEELGTTTIGGTNYTSFVRRMRLHFNFINQRHSPYRSDISDYFGPQTLTNPINETGILLGGQLWLDMFFRDEFSIDTYADIIAGVDFCQFFDTSPSVGGIQVANANIVRVSSNAFVTDVFNDLLGNWSFTITSD